MFCKQCGKQLDDNAKFCWACGAQTAPAQAAAPTADEVAAQWAPVLEVPMTQAAPAEPVYEQPVYEQPVYEQPVYEQPVYEQPVYEQPVYEQTVYEQPVWTPPGQAAEKKAKKPGKKWVPFAIIGGAVAAIVAIVLTLLLTGVFDSDSVRVFKAIEKSGKAFEEAEKALNMPDFKYIQEDKAYSMEFGFTLNALEDYEEFCGLGISGSVDYSLPGKKFGMTLVPSYGAVDILNVQMKVDDNMLYLGAPEITGKTFYSTNTETLFADLSKLSSDLEDFDDIRINLFELLQIVDEKMAFSKEDQEKIDKAVVELLKSVDAEKDGSEEISVNGNDLKCDKYDVVIETDALLDFFKVVVDITADAEAIEALTEICKSLNLPEELMDELDLSAEELDTAMIMEPLEEALKEFGDIELTVYLHKGYVAAVVYELEVEGTELEITLSIGGGDNYVDDLSLTMSADGTSIVLASSGNHSGKNGKYTDVTSMYVKNGREKMTVLTSNLSFDSKKSGDNFQWTMEVEEMGLGLNLSGNVSYDSKSMTVDMTDISISRYGDDMIAFSLYYKLGEFVDNIDVQKSVEVLKLSEDELMEEFEELSENIEDWGMGLAEQVPELLELFMSF